MAAAEERDTSRPVIVFRRTVNKGRKDKYYLNKETKEKELVQRGQHEQLWHCALADDKGELHPWATTTGIQQYVNKGYVPVDLYGFEQFFRRKDPNHDLVRELMGVYKLITGAVDNMRTIENLRKENQELRDLLAASSDPALKEKLAKLEADAKASEERHAAAMKKLQEDLAAQAQELEEAKKAAAAKDKDKGGR